MSAARSSHRSSLFRRQKSLDEMKNSSWQDFERFVGEYFRRDGYQVTENGGGGADGGVDLILRKRNERILVQCKQWRRRWVGIDPVKAFFATVVDEKADGGIFVTTAYFSKEARAFAERHPKLMLFDGDELERMRRQVG